MPDLELARILLLTAAGLGAGLINTIVGSGSLISFPALLAIGYPPVLANVTNNVGVLPGSISGAIGYRHEIRGQWRLLTPLVIATTLGGASGALLLLVLPAEVFNSVVPALIAAACVLVIIGPRLKRRAGLKRDLLLEGHGTQIRTRERGGALISATAFTGIYGGYFGAAQGVILLSVLSIMLDGSMQRANAVKNVLAASANFAATFVFIWLTPIDWFAAAAIAVGASIGGQLGARLGRRIPDLALRITIVVVGTVAIVALLMD